MNVILTGGGTAGHVIPNIALLDELKQRFDHVYYVGSENSMEKSLAEKHGIKYFSVPVVKLDRSHLWRNFCVPARLCAGTKRAQKLLTDLGASVVLAKGGYVSLPVALAAKKLGIPVVIHESDFSMGLANKICARFATRVLTAFDETAAKYRGSRVGIPLRKDFFFAPKSAGIIGKKTILFTGGSQGAGAINRFVVENAGALTKEFDVIHLTGKGKANNAPTLPGYTKIEYSNDMASLIRRADLVVCRSGATTLFEVATIGRPAIYVPLCSRATRGDQVLNARAFQNMGFGTTLPESNLDLNTFLQAARKALKLNISPMPPADKAKIADVVLDAARSKA